MCFSHVTITIAGMSVSVCIMLHKASEIFDAALLHRELVRFENQTNTHTHTCIDQALYSLLVRCVLCFSVVLERLTSDENGMRWDKNNNTQRHEHWTLNINTLTTVLNVSCALPLASKRRKTNNFDYIIYSACILYRLSDWHIRTHACTHTRFGSTTITYGSIAPNTSRYRYISSERTTTQGHTQNWKHTREVGEPPNKKGL